MTLRAGFIGTWGEWYYIRSFIPPRAVPTVRQQADRNTITTALLENVLASRLIQMKTPSNKKIYCITAGNIGTDDALFDPKILCSGIEIHNDCFIASNNDQGNFENVAHRTWKTNEGLYDINRS